MAQMTNGSGIEGLPKHFVDAMRTLFDIMDDQRTGYVKYAEIEERWQEDGAQNMPKNVLESLKKVTPPNGLLSFERFCAGLKMCLINNSMDCDQNSKGSQPSHLRPPSAPVLIADNRMKGTSNNNPNWTSPNTAAIRPNNAIAQQRALSMPQLLGARKDNLNARFDPNQIDPTRIRPESKLPKMNNPGKVYGPQKPAGRYGERTLDKSEIRTALQNWQMGLMNSERGDDRVGRGAADGKDRMDQRDAMMMQKKNVPTNRRREPRRHTLQNGIDYNMMKRMKQIEQEKDVLLQGLAAVEKARDWYMKQISITQEKIKHLGCMGSHVEQWTEAQQERLELQRARVLEVNRHLAALISSWDRGGLPLHMNLAFLTTTPNMQLQQDTLARLKQQNHRLTEEMSKKNQRIALLEQEKDSLLREMYDRQPGIVQSRRSTMIHHEQHDQTFII